MHSNVRVVHASEARSKADSHPARGNVNPDLAGWRIFLLRPPASRWGLYYPRASLTIQASPLTWWIIEIDASCCTYTVFTDKLSMTIKYGKLFVDNQHFYDIFIILLSFAYMYVIKLTLWVLYKYIFIQKLIKIEIIYLEYLAPFQNCLK